jgi:hypothetical protein
VLKQFAPLALANLTTKTSVAALAQMLVTTEPGSHENMMAAEKLAEIHDPAWFPLLLRYADQHPTIVVYVVYKVDRRLDAQDLPDRPWRQDANDRFL